MRLFFNGSSSVVVLGFAAFCTISQLTYAAGKIIFPWRAASHIVQQGGEFEILFQQTDSDAIESVILQGPYSRAILEIKTTESGSFTYDEFTQATVNRKITVGVPADTPEDLYDIIVNTGGEASISIRSLKVVQTFKTKYTLLHISDPHISRNWTGTDTDGRAEELDLMDPFVDLVNIIAPDLVMVTGDLIHDYTRFNANDDGWGGTTVTSEDDLPSIAEKWMNYYEGAKGFKGVQWMNAPTFSTTGNHDFYGVSSAQDKSSQWNEYCGLRVFGFSYGTTRYLVMDNYLGDQNDYPVLESYLEMAGPGLLRVTAHHASRYIDDDFLNKHSIGLNLYGHNHTPSLGSTGTMPTITMRPGSVARTDFNNWENEVGFFRLIWIEGEKVTYTEPLRFCVDPRVPYDEIESLLTLNFKSSDSASIQNDFNVDLPSTKVRFVMPKGAYKTDAGQIEQVFDNDTATIVDVRIDVGKESAVNINITKDLSLGLSHRVISPIFEVPAYSSILQIQMSLPYPANVDINLYQANGHLIRSLKNDALDADIHNFQLELEAQEKKGILFLEVNVIPAGQNGPPLKWVKKLVLLGG